MSLLKNSCGPPTQSSCVCGAGSWRPFPRPLLNPNSAYLGLAAQAETAAAALRGAPRWRLLIRGRPGLCAPARPTFHSRQPRGRARALPGPGLRLRSRQTLPTPGEERRDSPCPSVMSCLGTSCPFLADSRQPPLSWRTQASDLFIYPERCLSATFRAARLQVFPGSLVVRIRSSQSCQVYPRVCSPGCCQLLPVLASVLTPCFTAAPPKARPWISHTH